MQVQFRIIKDNKQTSRRVVKKSDLMHFNKIENIILQAEKFFQHYKSDVVLDDYCDYSVKITIVTEITV